MRVDCAISSKVRPLRFLAKAKFNGKEGRLSMATLVVGVDIVE